ncbi:MAG: HepT-like ribonuclease domain-containing protein [bacterium]
MPPDRRDPAHLWDLFKSAAAAVSALKDLPLDQYLGDENLRLVVERRLEIMGEAARRLSETFQEEHPEIPWRLIVAQRNFLIHQYDEIDHERIWRLVREELPPLLKQLEPLLPPAPERDS